MSTLVTMSQTVGDLTSGQTYIIKSRYAETLIAASQATKSTLRGSAAATSVPVSRRGKH